MTRGKRFLDCARNDKRGLGMTKGDYFLFLTITKIRARRRRI